MSKRTRGTARTTQRRPGTRPRTVRPAGSQPGTRRPSTVVGRPESELDLATDLAEEIVAEQPGPAQAYLQVARSTQPRSRVKPGSLLAARAATEYVYVAQDIKRILLVSGVLTAVMLALYVFIVVARVVPLPFY